MRSFCNLKDAFSVNINTLSLLDMQNNLCKESTQNEKMRNLNCSSLTPSVVHNSFLFCDSEAIGSGFQSSPPFRKE